MSNIQVTIIIATYYSEKTLQKTLYSVSNLSFKDWECIIIDGASKDKTLDIVNEFEKKDTRFKHISEQDKGIYDAYNKGWKLANGEWVLYLGSDDTLTPNGISTLVLNSYGTDIIYGNVILKYRNGKEKLQVAHEKCDFYGSEAFCCHQGVLMKRHIFKCMNGFDLRYPILADWDLMRRAGQAGFKFNYVNCAVAVFSVGGVSSDNYKVPLEAYKIYKKTKSPLYSIITLILQLIKMTLVIIKHKL